MTRTCKMWRAAIAVSASLLTAVPLEAKPRHSSNPKSVGQQNLIQHKDAPAVDDPSKFGGQGPSSQTSNSTTAVQVQPRGQAFEPNSAGVEAVHKQIDVENDMLRLEEMALDRKLTICRGC